MALHVNPDILKLNYLTPTEEHLGIANGSMACTDYNFHVEMTGGKI